MNNSTLPSLSSCFFTRQAAAAFLGFSVRKLDQLRADGKGPRYFRLGNKVRYWKHDVAIYKSGNKFMVPITKTHETLDPLSPIQTAHMLGVCLRTLAYWRESGQGPAYLYLERGIRYRVEDVLAYLGVEVAGV